MLSNQLNKGSAFSRTATLATRTAPCRSVAPHHCRVSSLLSSLPTPGFMLAASSDHDVRRPSVLSTARQQLMLLTSQFGIMLCFQNARINS